MGSWLSDIIEPVSGFISDNASWLKPVAQIGLGALRQNNVDESQSQYLDYLRQREQQNYQNSVDQINAYNAQLASAGSGGGGSGNAAASAAAARATEKNRMKASKKSNKAMQNTYKELLAMYAPYRATADKLLPQMTQTYENSLGIQNALAKFVGSPEQTAKLNASVPSWQIKIPLPDSVRVK